MAQQAVIFSLGQEEYGMPIEVVREIVRIEAGRSIPKAPDYVKGLITLRGQAIPIIDMHVRFGIGKGGEMKGDSQSFALIAEVHGNLVGFAVDGVREVRVLDQIAPPPPLVTAPFINGIVNLPDRMIMQLVPEKILERDEVSGLNQLVGA